MNKELQNYIEFIKTVQISKPKEVGGIFIDPASDFKCEKTEPVRKRTISK